MCENITPQEKVDLIFTQIELIGKLEVELKTHMEKHLLTLEEQYRKERERVEQLFEEQKKTYESCLLNFEELYSKERELTENLFERQRDAIQSTQIPVERKWTEKEHKLAANAWSKWKRYRFTSLRDNTRLLKQANATSIKLKKEFALLTNTLYSPLSADDYDQETPKTIVAVEVQDMENGVTQYQSLDKLRQRLVDSNPFYEILPWFRIVGRGFVYLSNLLYPVSLVHKIPLVNEKGDIRGYLKVVVQPVVGEVGVKQSSVRVDFETYKCKTDNRKNECLIEIYSTKNDDEDSGCEDTPDHLAIGKEFTFRVIVLHATGIPTEYADIFCKFNFLHKHNDVFLTEPVKNSGKENRLGLHHTQNITVTITRSFIDYLKTQPIVFEVFGHHQQHSLHRQPPPRILSPSPCPAHINANVDVLVWFEICELASNGEYVPVVVEHKDDLPCNGLFVLHYGLQRRIRITIVHDHVDEIKWRGVRDFVIGGVRTTEEFSNDSSNMSLGLFPGKFLKVPGDDRVMFQFEVEWGSSSHDSLFLKRVTPSGEQIFMTISAYLELENCDRPAIITKDLSMVIREPDAKIGPWTFKNPFSGNCRSVKADRLSGVYELLLRRAGETGVSDTSSTYVGDGCSPTFDHQWELEKLTRLEEVERARYLLLLREPLKYHLDHTKNESETKNVYVYTEKEMMKCPSLIHGKDASEETEYVSFPHLPEDQELMYVPYMEQIRISPIVAKRGYLNVLDHGTREWKKRWMVVRRPYVVIFRSKKDSLERALINFTTARVEYSKDHLAMVGVPNSFSLVTKYRGYFLEAPHEKALHEWLNAIDPLLAG